MDRATRIYTAADVRRLLPIGDCIEAVERGFRSGDVTTFVGGVSLPRGKIHVKAAATTGDQPLFAAKMNANFPGNPAQHGLPTIQGVLVLFEGVSGRPLAIMDSSAITMIRTAAASAVAARHLAARDAHTLAVVGCGAQALAHVAAMCAVRDITRVRAFDLDREVLERFVADARGVSGLDVAAAASLADCTRGADIVVTCTTAREPFLDETHVRAGTFVAAVGTDSPLKAEITPALMARADVCVDDLAQCAEMGDLRCALAAGVMQPGDVRGSLADVVRGTVSRRPDRVTVFDSTGVPLEDVVAAALVHERGAATDAGFSITLA